MADARQLRLDSERAFRPARAGCRKFFDELNDLGWDLQLQAQKVERDAQKLEDFNKQLGPLQSFLTSIRIVPIPIQR
jgi:hypothetical protein